MKFSVLLPTHNRLEYLRYAVETVLRQDYADWELIISDNDSTDDIAGYIQSVGDSRIKYYRTDRFVPVTDNWNNALQKSGGDYVIMLGDDDCLMRGFFSTMAGLIETYKRPPFIFTDAYLFGYPGVLPDYPSGYLRRGYNRYFEPSRQGVLDRATALEIVRKSLSLITTINYNMQLSVISRDLINALADRGPFFQSLFPDYYATVVAFLNSERPVIYQQPVVTIGITPKSYGFYHFNRKQKSGQALLYSSSPEQNPNHLREVLLPGAWEYTGWLSAMDTVKANYGRELEKYRLTVDYGHYRRLQIVYNYKNYYIDRRIPDEEFIQLKRLMRGRERLVYGLGLSVLFRVLGLLKDTSRKSLFNFLRRLGGQHENIFVGEQWRVSDFKTILDVFERMPSRHA